MKRTEILTILVLALGLMVCLVELAGAAPMGTAFTYQGRLIDANDAADGLYDFEFKLFDDPCTGTQQGGPIDVNDLDVIDGYFTVEPDFNSPFAFNGYARWLEIGVRPGDSNDPNAFVTLSPRTELTPTPYAIYAETAGGIPSGITGSGIANYIPKFTDAATLGNSAIYESAGKVRISGASTDAALLRIEDSDTQTTFDAFTVLGETSLQAIGAGRLPLIVINADGEALRTLGDLNVFNGDMTVGGKVGIGTTGPAQDLEVEGGVFIDHSGMSHGADAGVALTVDGQLGKDILQVRDKGANRKLVVDSAGNVGIGTTSPGAKLDVNGQVKITGGSPGMNKVLTSDASGLASWQTPPAGADNLGNHTATQNIRLNGHWLSGDGANEGVFVNNAGKVGIGTTSPASKLHVEDAADVVFTAKSTWGADSTFTFGGYATSTWNYGPNINAMIDSEPGPHGALTLYYTSTPRVKIDASGDSYLNGGKVGIGTLTPTELLTIRGGNLLIERSDGTDIVELGEGLDYAEGFDVSESTKIDAGSVLIIDSKNPGKLALSNKSYDTKVAGIVAGANGMGSGVRLGAGQFDYDVALAGRVYCNVDAAQAGVEPGDLLTTSATPGYAMKSTDYARAQGAILGKAMEGLEKGQKGQILVLVTLQ